MNIRELLGKRPLFFDGAMGTMLQQAGLAAGEAPEVWNLTHPEEIASVHRRYVEAGCDILKTNTFGANRVKLEGPYTTERVVTAGVALARQEAAKADRPVFVAVDIGPTGKLLAPLGDLAFEDAVAAFGEQAAAGERAGADCVLIETMSDTYEVKAAVLGAKEATALPVFATLMFDEQGKLLTGADVETAAALLEGLGVDAIGFNCGVGPEQLRTMLPRLRAACSLPIICNPNAGLPHYENNQTYYDVDATTFAATMQELVQQGAWLLGGCCGTTPEYIAALTARCRACRLLPLPTLTHTAVTSYSRTVLLDNGPVLVGERINPTGKKRFKQALRDNDMEYILDEGLAQKEHGAHILDVNVGLPEINEAERMEAVVTALQGITNLPLQIDTSDPVALERALRIYNGKPLINSVNGKQESLEAVLPLVKKYGGAVVALTLDENGIPDTAQGRLAIARRIVEEAERIGIPRRDVVVDVLTMTVSTGSEAARVTLEALALVKKELGVKTILGVSNVSFGLPRREILNAAFLTMALHAGLDVAILNPGSPAMMEAYSAYGALMGLDNHCETYIARFASSTERVASQPVSAVTPRAASPAADMTLRDAVKHGRTEAARTAARAQLTQRTPMELIREELVPALDDVGRDFEKGTLFLPQLLMSADAAKAAFEELRVQLEITGGNRPKGDTVVLATVKGDVHDIGKNIVKVLLENYGYHVVDLGKDVDPQAVVDAVCREQAQLVGLSALMTTTVPSMEATIRALREAGLTCKVIVGGAVMTQEYADSIGADAYSKDAMVTVHYAQQLFGR